jgi:GTPase involved in cell partitioning and DNA repair
MPSISRPRVAGTASGKDRNGAAGKDLVIKVPVGTQQISTKTAKPCCSI